MKRIPLSILVVVVFAAACSPIAPVAGRETTTSAPSTTAGTTTTTFMATTSTRQPSVRTVPCSSTPPLDFAILCESYEILSESYFQDLDLPALAAAAAAGVRARTSSSIVAPNSFTCVLPSDDFLGVCELMADRVGRGELSLPDAVEAAVQGIFRFGLDPFSSYVGADLAARLTSDDAGLVLGLGMAVAALDTGGNACSPLGPLCRLEVITVFRFTAAEQAAILRGDVIEEIDGTSVSGLSLAEATALLDGEGGTAVAVTVVREGVRTERRLTRDVLRLDPIEYEVIGRAVHIRLNEFSQVSARALGAVLQLEEVERARGIVLDLRDNPGGLVLAAVAVVSQFLDDGLVMTQVTPDGKHDLSVVQGGLDTEGRRLVVLVNESSASASEVVASVLQERGRATIVGEPTFGKDLVQNTWTLHNGGEIRVTVARWTTPQGASVRPTGVIPDEIIEDLPGSDDDPVLERGLRLAGR